MSQFIEKASCGANDASGSFIPEALFQLFFRRKENPQERDLELFFGVASRVKANVQFMKDQYGIDVEMHRIVKEEKTEMVDLKKLGLVEALRATNRIREEIVKYPPSYIKGIDIKKFRLLRSITHKRHHDVGGLAFTGGDVYITGGSSDVYDRQVLHHELFHRRDYEHSELKESVPVIGHIIDIIRERMLDHNWATLNSKGRDVYARESFQTVSQAYPLTHRPLGFARTYGLKTEWEDRATVAEYLMTNPEWLLREGETDRV